MARNLEKDAIEEKKRRERFIKAGFELFSEKGIENVSLQEVATRADAGIATLYNYYQNKIKLVVAISADMWKKVWENYYNSMDVEKFNDITAYERIEAYLDIIIEIYKNKPEVLKFSGDYKTYIQRQNVSESELQEHLKVLQPMDNMFHISYEKAKVDRSIRTDIDEKEMFISVGLTMLAMSERYAQGLVWARKDDNDYLEELINLKDMILKWIK